MKKNLSVLALIGAAAFFAGARSQPPQNPDNTVVQIAISTTAGDHTTCTLHAGQSQLCLANDAACPLWTSNKGAAYINMCPGGSVVGMVKSVQGKQPDATGNVSFTATTTVTPPGMSFAANGALTISAPTATTTLQ